MPRRVIVYTRPGGSVAVCSPSLTAMCYMTSGGGRWDGSESGFIDRQIDEQAKYGVGEGAAHRFVMAMQFGGCTDAEAYEAARDRFCAHLGTGCELWHPEDVPDKWFRNAWRRSANGGPISISMKTARRIQYQRMTEAAAKSRAVRQLGRWRDHIRKAETPEDLRRLWPEGLNCG